VVYFYSPGYIPTAPGHPGSLVDLEDSICDAERPSDIWHLHGCLYVSGVCSLSYTPLPYSRPCDSLIPQFTILILVLFGDMRRRTRASLLIFCLVPGTMIFLSCICSSTVQRHRRVIFSILCGMRHYSVLANRVGKTVLKLSLLPRNLTKLQGGDVPVRDEKWAHQP
jgi:hypothetical protein